MRLNKSGFAIGITHWDPAKEKSLLRLSVARGSVGCQNSRRNANCISRGVPDPTGVTGDTVFTVLMMLPNPVVFDELKVDCG